MSAVAETETIKTTEKSRTRLDQLRRTLSERQGEITEAQEAVQRLRAEEEQAVAEAARRAPTKRIFSVGSPVERIRRKREKLEADLPLRQRELEALRLALDEAEAEHADEDLAAACKRLRASHDRQRACYERASALLVDLADVWTDLACEISDADADAGRVLASDAYRLASDQARTEFDRAANAVALVEPCPRSLGQFALRLIEAATSDENRRPDFTEHEHGMGETVDPNTGIRTPLPPKRVQVASGARYLDQRRVLRDVAPDLRAAPTIKPSTRLDLLGGSPSMETI